MLIYSAIVSLDGYTTDDEGKFDWAEPDGLFGQATPVTLPSVSVW